MILRIRTQLGTWRVQDVKPEDKIGFICSRIENEHQTILTTSLSADISGTQQYDIHATVQQVGLKHGDMVYASVDVTKTGVHENAQASVKRVTKSGDIVIQSYENVSNSNGFRPGMLSLRSMKKHWTLNEFIRLDEQFEFKLKAAEKAPCTLASTDEAVMSEFVGYMQSCNFQRIRIGYLYGTIDEKVKSVRADFLYEPPQQTTDVSFELLEDPMEVVCLYVYMLICLYIYSDLHIYIYLDVTTNTMTYTYTCTYAITHPGASQSTSAITRCTESRMGVFSPAQRSQLPLHGRRSHVRRGAAVARRRGYRRVPVRDGESDAG